MMTHSAAAESGKTWWTVAAGAAGLGAAGVGWSLADVAGAAAAGGAVLLGSFAIRWAMSQKSQQAPRADEATSHQPSHSTSPDFATPKLAGFYKEDSYKSDTRTALADGGTRSGLYSIKAPRSKTGIDL